MQETLTELQQIIAGPLLYCFNQGPVPTVPVNQLAFFEKRLQRAAITATDCHAAARHVSGGMTVVYHEETEAFYAIPPATPFQTASITPR